MLSDVVFCLLSLLKFFWEVFNEDPQGVFFSVDISPRCFEFIEDRCVSVIVEGKVAFSEY